MTTHYQATSLESSFVPLVPLSLDGWSTESAGTEALVPLTRAMNEVVAETVDLDCIPGG